jgi:phosphoadenosine phosphosulfate reductase
MHVTRRDLAPLNDRFRGRAPLESLRFAQQVFGERAAILCSMQRACTALCHMADAAGLPFDVIFVDTGVLHPETLATRDALAAAHPRLRVITLHPTRTMADQTAAEGVLYLTREGQERCCDQRKTSPLLGLRGRYDALIGTLRRHEGGARAEVEPFGLDAAMGALRVHPFADLAPGAIDAYLAEHRDVVVNPLHSLGFPSIGCFPCTTPVLPDEPERAGRWRHLATVQYCGINPVDRGDEGAVDLDERYAPLFS